MSARRRTYVLAPEARHDLADILVYSERLCGRRQRGIYRAALRRGFETVRDNPGIGIAEDEIEPGMRAHSVEHHVPYDRLNDNIVEIARILHERMDPDRHRFR
ncbi:MAG TPA: type II toxin-antitoxin system RelE/ParE family toxin [Thermomicrobiales bacterium]|jgi:toxin ParE1/3/4